MSLSADSDIRLLTAKVIKVKTDKLEIPISRLHCEFGTMQINMISHKSF